MECNLDASCREHLLKLTPEQAEHVLQRGAITVDPNRGSASGMVMGRIRSAQAAHPSRPDPSTLGPLSERIEKFVEDYSLDKDCADALRLITPNQAEEVLARGSLKVDPTKGSASAMVQARIRKVQKEIQEARAPSEDTPRRVEEFILATEGLDEQCAAALRALPPDQAEEVLSRGSVRADPSKGTVSGMVMARIKQAKVKGKAKGKG